MLGLYIKNHREKMEKVYTAAQLRKLMGSIFQGTNFPREILYMGDNRKSETKKFKVLIDVVEDEIFTDSNGVKWKKIL